MKVFLLSGSVGKKSFTRTFLLHLEELLQAEKISTEYWDMGDRPLPIAVPEYYLKPELSPDKNVGAFVKAAREADAVILGTPLYYNSFSGVLKNALDTLPPQAFHNKPIGLISHSNNARSCARPSNELYPVVSALGGYPALTNIGTTDTDFAYDADTDSFKVTNEGITARSQNLIQELQSLSQALKQLA